MNPGDSNVRAFEFFEYLARIEALATEYPPIGTSKSPMQDPVRLAQRVSLAHAGTEIDRVERGSPGRVYVTFFGLTGPNGPLPLHLTEQAIRRATGRAAPEDGDIGSSHADSAMADFFDVFHHRMLCLLYRSWKASRLGAEDSREPRFRLFLSSMIGENGLDVAEGRFNPPDDLPLDPKLYFSGLLGCSSRSAEGLARLLSSFFKAPARITEFVGQWIPLPQEDRVRLGDTAGLARLGRDCIIGARTWATHLRFRLTLGPLSLAAYLRLSPGGDGHRQLASWLRMYCGAELGVDVQLILRRENVPTLRLGAGDVRLGLTTWLSSSRPSQDPADFIYSCN